MFNKLACMAILGVGLTTTSANSIQFGQNVDTGSCGFTVDICPLGSTLMKNHVRTGKAAFQDECCVRDSKITCGAYTHAKCQDGMIVNTRVIRQFKDTYESECCIPEALAPKLDPSICGDATQLEHATCPNGKVLQYSWTRGSTKSFELDCCLLQSLAMCSNSAVNGFCPHGKVVDNLAYRSRQSSFEEECCYTVEHSHTYAGINVCGQSPEKCPDGTELAVLFARPYTHTFQEECCIRTPKLEQTENPSLARPTETVPEIFPCADFDESECNKDLEKEIYHLNASAIWNGIDQWRDACCLRNDGLETQPQSSPEPEVSCKQAGPTLACPENSTLNEQATFLGEANFKVKCCAGAEVIKGIQCLGWAKCDLGTHQISAIWDWRKESDLQVICCAPDDDSISTSAPSTETSPNAVVKHPPLAQPLEKSLTATPTPSTGNLRPTMSPSPADAHTTAAPPSKHHDIGKTLKALPTASVYPPPTVKENSIPRPSNQSAKITPSPSTHPSITSTPSTAPSITPSPSTPTSFTPTPSTHSANTPSPSTHPSITSTPSTAPSITSTSSTAPSITPSPSTHSANTPSPSTHPSITSTPSTAPSITPSPSTPTSIAPPTSTPSSFTPTPSTHSANTPSTSTHPSITSTPSPAPSIPSSSTPSQSIPTPIGTSPVINSPISLPHVSANPVSSAMQSTAAVQTTKPQATTSPLIKHHVDIDRQKPSPDSRYTQSPAGTQTANKATPSPSISPSVTLSPTVSQIYQTSSHEGPAVLSSAHSPQPSATSSSNMAQHTASLTSITSIAPASSSSNPTPIVTSPVVNSTTSSPQLSATSLSSTTQPTAAPQLVKPQGTLYPLDKHQVDIDKQKPLPTSEIPHFLAVEQTANTTVPEETSKATTPPSTSSSTVLSSAVSQSIPTPPHLSATSSPNVAQNTAVLTSATPGNAASSLANPEITHHSSNSPSSSTVALIPSSPHTTESVIPVLPTQNIEPVAPVKVQQYNGEPAHYLQPLTNPAPPPEPSYEESTGESSATTTESPSRASKIYESVRSTPQLTSTSEQIPTPLAKYHEESAGHNTIPTETNQSHKSQPTTDKPSQFYCGDIKYRKCKTYRTDLKCCKHSDKCSGWGNCKCESTSCCKKTQKSDDPDRQITDSGSKYHGHCNKDGTSKKCVGFTKATCCKAGTDKCGGYAKYKCSSSYCCSKTKKAKDNRCRRGEKGCTGKRSTIYPFDN